MGYLIAYLSGINVHKQVSRVMKQQSVGVEAFQNEKTETLAKLLKYQDFNHLP